jgi:hypothetical protein
MKIKGLILAILLALATAASATLSDQYTLSQDVNFQHRVQESIVAAAIAIANESPAVALHSARIAFGRSVLASPSSWAASMAPSLATDATIAADAGSPPIQANVTDAHINTAVASQWNSYVNQ